MSRRSSEDSLGALEQCVLPESEGLGAQGREMMIEIERAIRAIEAARDDMVAKGATVLNGGKPRIGAHGTPVIFVHLKNMGGVLVELMDTPKRAH